MKYVPKDCGKHFGPVSGPCAKCRHFAKMDADPKIRAGRQYYEGRAAARGAS